MVPQIQAPAKATGPATPPSSKRRRVVGSTEPAWHSAAGSSERLAARTGRCGRIGGCRRPRPAPWSSGRGLGRWRPCWSASSPSGWWPAPAPSTRAWARLRPWGSPRSCSPGRRSWPPSTSSATAVRRSSPPLAAWTINLRMVLYSASLAPHLAGETLRTRLGVAYLLTDQAYAVSIARWTGDDDPDPTGPLLPRRRADAVGQLADLHRRRCGDRFVGARRRPARVRRAARVPRAAGPCDQQPAGGGGRRRGWFRRRGRRRSSAPGRCPSRSARWPGSPQAQPSRPGAPASCPSRRSTSAPTRRTKTRTPRESHAHGRRERRPPTAT